MTPIRSLLVSLTLLAGLTATPVSAQPSAAQAFVEDRQATASRLLGRPASAARNRELQALFDGFLDYGELGRRSLGRHWEQRTEPERREFVGLLEQLVERAYQENLQRTLSFEVRFENAEARGDTVVVHSVAQSRSNRRAPPVEIDYTLRQSGGAWRVVDIHTDGVSLVANYRAQFNRLIAREGWAGLLQRMRDRIANGSADL